MKVYAVLCVLVIASVRGRVIIDIPSNSLEPSNGLETTCPYTAIPGTMFDVPYILLNAQHECYKPEALFLRQLDTASGTEEYRRIFKQACKQVPEVRTCIADVIKNAESCLTPVQMKMYRTVSSTVALGMENVCGDDSETMARMYGEELKPLDFLSQIRVVGCVSGTALKTQYNLETDMAEYTMRRYRGISEGRQCITNIVQRKGKTAPHFQSFMEAILSGMTCLSPSTQEVVLCRTLEENTHNTELEEN